jgi:uncharacterized membrane protein YccC
MPRPEIDPESSNALTVAARLAETLAQFQAELSEFVLGLAESPSKRVQIAGRSWKRLQEQHAAAETGFAEFGEALEDLLDVAEAERALQEPGESVLWSDVKSELGLL